MRLKFVTFLPSDIFQQFLVAPLPLVLEPPFYILPPTLQQIKKQNQYQRIICFQTY